MVLPVHGKGRTLKVLSLVSLLAASFALWCLMPYAVPAGNDASKKNDKAISAMREGNPQLAIQILREVLKANPSSSSARGYLSIAYTLLGLRLKSDPQAALTLFHKACYFNPGNDYAFTYLNATIKGLGKNPDSFGDRLLLAKEAKEREDFEGVVVEFQQALKIKDDAKVHSQLELSENRLGGPPPAAVSDKLKDIVEVSKMK